MKSLNVSPQDAAQELLRRRNARKSLLDFTQYTYPQYQADPVHHLIASYLDRVVAGEIKRLMVFAPPQHGKSELTSVRLPAYWLGRRPNDPIIVTSYGAELAEGKSRQARDIVESAEYRALFGDLRAGEIESVQVRPDSRAVQRWQLMPPHRGRMLAVGVGGPVTGHGALLGIIDDPHANWEEAQSETLRNRVWEWFRGTFRTRIWEGGAIVLIMTRWHEDDLAGKLLKAQPGAWTVLRLPALAESQEERDENNRHMGLAPGESDPLDREAGAALSPQRFSATELQSIRRDVGSVVFASEYQGGPRASEGNLIKRTMLRIVHHAPPATAWRVRYWDKAVSTKKGAKFSAGVRLAITLDGRVFVEDVVRGQWSTKDRREIMVQTAELDAQAFNNSVFIFIEQEPGSSGVDSVQDEIRLLARFPVFADKATGDKDVRLMPFIAQAEALNVMLLAGAWNQAYIDEMVVVPNGTYRDQVDATAGAYNRAIELIHLQPEGAVVHDEAVSISQF